jgi:hypothetical protein
MPTIDLPLGDRIKILKDSDGWFGRAPASSTAISPSRHAPIR